MSLCRVATTPRTLLGAVGGWRTATRAMYSTAATGRVTLGDVSKELTEPTNAALVPVLYALESVPKDSLPPPGALPLTQEVLGHLRWMLQKDQLGQDVFLIGPPGPRRRSLAMAFCELTQREVEYVSLSRDTTESDLKQRREIRQATAYYVNQAAVKAAIGGRILVLEGIEKAERNVLPVLNNLLENREMRLESGEFLVAPQRYDALLKEHSKEELDKAKLLRVSENFRVIALGLPVPAYSGNPLDPPLRSRFQARDVAHMSYATQELVLSKLGAVQARSLQGLAGFASALNLAAEELKVPKFPVDLLARTARLLQSFPQLPPGVALQAVYPYRTLLPADRQKMIDELLGRFKLAVSPDTTQTHYTMGSVTPKTPTTAVVKFKVGKGEVGVDVPWGGHKHPGIEEHPFVPTPYHENLLAALTQSHVVGDICLLGGRGVGKSAVVAEFARRLGYHVEPMFMYQDMTSRDLLQQRATLSNGDTIWKPSPLVSAARAGHLLLLDGVHHVNAGTLTVLQRLIHDRELTLPDGTRLLHGARFEELKKKHGYTTEQLEEMSIHAIHPSFRIVALAEPPRPGATGGWLGDEAMTMFQYHNMRSLNATEEAAVLKSLVPEISANQLSSLVDFAHKLRSATDHTVLSLSTSLSTRQLLRICRRVRRYQHTDLYSAVHTVCLSRFLPNIARDTLDKLLSESGIKPLDDLSTDIDLKIEQIAEAGTNYVQIGDVRAPVRMLEASERVLVPDVVYYDNHQHTVVMGDMMKDFVLGEHLLLVGNQGVGKNKIVDRFLQLLSLPREYMQLHRDTTVQALTLQPTVKNGVIVYEDSALVLAVTHGRVLVVDEADKAPTHVTGILKSLAENGTMRLSDGRVIVPSSETDIRGDGVIPIHPNFRLIVLANRPGFPFLGHDFFAALGDVFSCHSIDNADPESELSMLRSYGPQVPVGVLRKLTGVFRDLRRLVTEGSLAYPYSTRELVHIVKHLQQYPDEGLGSTIRNVFDFDAYDTDTKELLAETLSRHGIPLGATAASVSLIPESPLPSYTVFDQWALDGTNQPCRLHSIAVKPQGPYQLGVGQSYRTSRHDNRSHKFTEERYNWQMSMPPGARVTAAAGAPDNSVHVLTANPTALYSFSPDHRTYTYIDLSDLFYTNERGVASRWAVYPLVGNMAGSVVVHDGTTNAAALINSEKRQLFVARLSALFTQSGSQRRAFSSWADFERSKNALASKFVPSSLPNHFIVYTPKEKQAALVDVGSWAAHVLTSPVGLHDIWPITAHSWLVATSEGGALQLLSKPSDSPSPVPTTLHPISRQHTELVQYVASEFLGPKGLERVAPQSKQAANESEASEGSQSDVPKQPLALPWASSSSYANVLLGFDTLAQSEGSPSPTTIHAIPRPTPFTSATSLYLPKEQQLIHVEPVLPVIGQEGSPPPVVASLEVVDLARQTLKKLDVAGGTRTQQRSTLPKVIPVALGDGGILTVDDLGQVRAWDTDNERIVRDLATWTYMIGQGSEARPIQLTREHYSGKDVSGPKHGKMDPNNTPHVGGNTWAGGTGGRDTAGLGGKGGPYRLDAGHDVFQISKEEKDAVPEEVKKAAREMGLKAFRERLNEIEMSEHDSKRYSAYFNNVAGEVHDLRKVLKTLESKNTERQWLKNQTVGDLDDNRLIDGVTGESNIYKRRGTPPPIPGFKGEKPKRVRFVLDLSGSMYRFNGFDQRLTHMCECACMIMESFDNSGNTIKYDIVGHSGESPEIYLVSEDKTPRNEKERLKILDTMVAHAQFCMSGDNTLTAAQMAIQGVTHREADEHFVLVLSDANLDIYGIHPMQLGTILGSDDRVTACAVFLGSLGDQAEKLKKGLGPGRGFVCMNTKDLPAILRQIFQSTFLKGT